MVRLGRYAYIGFAWLFVAGVLLQVFFIGLGLFVESDFKETHAYFGWVVLHLFPLIILVAAAIARAGRALILRSVALAVTVFLVPILAAVRSDLPIAAAFHPVGALVAFWLAIGVARGGMSRLRSAEPGAGWRADAAIACIVAAFLFVMSF